MAASAQSLSAVTAAGTNRRQTPKPDRGRFFPYQHGTFLGEGRPLSRRILSWTVRPNEAFAAPGSHRVGALNALFWCGF